MSTPWLPHKTFAMEVSPKKSDKKNGDPDAIRTRDPQIRNLMLYPAELRGLVWVD
jgi:hypothetical protein